MRADRVDQQGVAVRLRSGYMLGSDVPRGARPVLGDYLLPPLLGELLAEGAGENVRGAARREGNDDADGPRRIGLRIGRQLGPQQRSEGRCGGSKCGGPEDRSGHWCASHTPSDLYTPLERAI